jgi:hypothetical protein
VRHQNQVAADEELVQVASRLVGEFSSPFELAGRHLLNGREPVGRDTLYDVVAASAATM